MSLLSNIHVHVHCRLAYLDLLLLYSLKSFYKAKGLKCSKAVEMLSCNYKSFNQFNIVN